MAPVLVVSMFPLLLLIVVLPLVFAALLFFVPERNSLRLMQIAICAVFLLCMIASYIGLSQGFESLSFQQTYLQSLGINLSLQLTKYSSIFLMASAVVLLSSALVASTFIKESRRIYSFLFLLAAGLGIGVFLSDNLFFFYVFWQMCEVAMFFTMYIFGSYDRRYAAIKYLIYSIFAGMFLLLGIVTLYISLPLHTFSITQILSQASSISTSSQLIAAAFLAIAFLIRIPVFPFHNWLPDAHTEAPTPSSMVLSGVMLNFGGYGLLLLFSMLPVAAAYAPYFMFLLGFSAIYGAFVAIRQNNLKRFISYTSMIQMGIAAFGIASLTPLGIAGGVYVMLAHSLTISLLFLVSGAADDSFGTVLINRLTGIVRDAPFLAYSFFFATIAFVGMPLTSGFIGYFLTFQGAFSTYGIVGIFPIAALLLDGAFLLLVLEKAFFSSSQASEPLSNPGIEVICAALFLIAASLILGILPSLLLSSFAV